MSAVEGRTDMLLKRADLQRFYQFSGTDWLMCEPIDRRVRVSCCTWLTLGLWPMTALRHKRPFARGTFLGEVERDSAAAAKRPDSSHGLNGGGKTHQARMPEWSGERRIPK